MNCNVKSVNQNSVDPVNTANEGLLPGGATSMNQNLRERGTNTAKQKYSMKHTDHGPVGPASTIPWNKSKVNQSYIYCVLSDSVRCCFKDTAKTISQCHVLFHKSCVTVLQVVS